MPTSKSNKIEIPRSAFTSKTPDSPGVYLWRNSLEVELIHVYLRPGGYRYGSHWESYLAIDQGRSVDRLRGTFCKLEIEE